MGKIESCHVMRLDMMSWEEVAEYLTRHDAAILPVGSTEQIIDRSAPAEIHCPSGAIANIVWWSCMY